MGFFSFKNLQILAIMMSFFPPNNLTDAKNFILRSEAFLVQKFFLLQFDYGVFLKLLIHRY